MSLANGLDNGSNGSDNFAGAIDAVTAELHLTEVEVRSNQSGNRAGISLANGDGVISDNAITANLASSQGRRASIPAWSNAPGCKR